MYKRMIIMLIGLGILFGGIFGYNTFKASMMKKYMASIKEPPIAVSVCKVESLSWQPQLESIGTLKADRGVDVTTEISGIVKNIYFKSGDEAKEGQILVQLNDDNDLAQLHSNEALAQLAKIVYERDKKQLEVKAVSQATVDFDEADLKSKLALVDQQAAIVKKKKITAPFAGKLGITNVNPGQYINPGEKIVTLQLLDPLYIDFYIPQQKISKINIGQKLDLTTDAYPDKTFEGKITSINPIVDIDSRNFLVEAAINNPNHELMPGMYASVKILIDKEETYLTLPQTSVTFSPYGQTIYILKNIDKKDAHGNSLYTAKQIFITTGETRGDQIAILQGIDKEDTVVNNGQNKLKNGCIAFINNQIQPLNDKNPNMVDE